ncbi:MAG: PucR family transcriptional regulator [Actinobacteria bacterium]|nr:PucR family transcriptional regulator [Actinomycetota bacterium]
MAGEVTHNRPRAQVCGRLLGPGGQEVTVSITVRELLGTPHLGLHLFAGGAGLDRKVTWAHVCELEDPARWLEGGELVLTTGIGVPPGPARQAAYVRLMAKAGIAALAVSQDLLAPPLTQEMKREGDESAFPILEVSIEVPFVAISRTVAAAVQDGAQGRLLTHLRIFDTLRATSIESLGDDELFRRLEELSGFRLYLATPSGRPLLEDVPAPPSDLVDAHLPRAGGEPPWIPGGFVISIPLWGRTVGYLFAMERAGAEPAGLTAAQHIATIAMLELANRRREREVLRREGAETLAELLSGALEPETAGKRLSLAGFDPGRALVLLAMDGDADPSTLQEEWAELGVPHLLLQQRELYALVPECPEALRPSRGVDGIRAGASLPFQAGAGFAVPRREALWALQRAVERGVPLVSFAGEGGDATWLPADAAVLQGLVERVLGPVLEHDAVRGSDLVRSLRVWLEQDRRTERAAELLGVHKHTLQYRLRRVQQLTGRGLARVQDTVDVWLALRALEVIGGDPQVRPPEDGKGRSAPRGRGPGHEQPA